MIKYTIGEIYMGHGYLIGCIECVKKDDLNNFFQGNTKINGTIFNIATGGGMLCFCKEQLEKRYGIYKKYNRKYRLLAAGDPPEEIYETLGSPTNDETIDKNVYDNLKNGFDFTEILGHLPYYCDTCKKMFNHFYFQMKRGKEIYVPNYKCVKCKNDLEPICPTWEKSDGMGWAKDLSKIKFKMNLYNENGLIQIKTKKDEKRLICDYCKNDKFSILADYFYG
jgi:hypothetical protein